MGKVLALNEPAPHGRPKLTFWFLDCNQVAAAIGALAAPEDPEPSAEEEFPNEELEGVAILWKLSKV